MTFIPQKIPAAAFTEMLVNSPTASQVTRTELCGSISPLLRSSVCHNRSGVYSI